MAYRLSGLIATGIVMIMLGFGPFPAMGETWSHEDLQKPPAVPASPQAPKEHKKQAWDQEPAVTHHSVMINGKPLKYTATTGYLPLLDEAGKATGHVFFTAYILDGEGNGTKRPITFAFNGGPGAASVWLHMSAAGPKRVVLSDDGMGLPPPYTWVTNEETWLDLTDLVFIDPVGTGYSRPAEGTKSEEFHGVQKDIESVAQFIRLYCTKYERWLSPRFLAGESYGTTRAAGLSKYLQDTVGMALNGVILISSALNFQTIGGGPDNDLAYALLLPAYTLTAAYHKRLSPALQADLEKTREEVERFALGDYLVALAKGYALPASERNSIIEKLALYTGMRQVSIRNSNLRIDRGAFARQLLEEKNLRVGMYDSRFTGHYRPGTFMGDPSMFEVTAPLLSACNDYLRRELRWETDLDYEFLSEKTNREWKWGSASGGYVDLTMDLASALSQNRFLRVFVASGYYDLVTSYFASKYTFNRMGPETDLRDRITLEYYDGGHQLYMDKRSREKLKRDIAAFFGNTIRAAPGPRTP